MLNIFIFVFIEGAPARQHVNMDGDNILDNYHNYTAGGAEYRAIEKATIVVSMCRL